MTREIPFTKMHGIGNDYIYINCMDRVPGDLASLAIEMSDRHKGVGGDGIILICPSEIADFKMRIFNADGSEARMCGNGSRCVGRFVYEKGLTTSTTITLETLAGVRRLTLHPATPTGAATSGTTSAAPEAPTTPAAGLTTPSTTVINTVTVDMGIPNTDALSVPVRCEKAQMIAEPVATSAGTVRVTAVSMGNPHGVIIVDSLDGVDVHGLGAELEHHAMWPDRANIEFVEVLNRNEIRMRVWERGSGETQACGTGACASVVACVLNGLTDRHATVHLLGGDLDIDWDEATGHVNMTGGATTVFEGVYTRQHDV